jgi:hypothetical protein
MDEKDYPLDGDDRAEWNRAWASMPHRRLLTLPRIDVAAALGLGCEAVVSLTISEDPPQFSANSWRQSDICPVCGATTVGTQRAPATLNPMFANGISYLAFGVWVHRPCFESCPAAGEPAPIPW